MTSPNPIIKLLYETPGIVNLSDKDIFEPQPGVFASVYINLKAPLYHPSVRKQLTQALATCVSPDTDFICGMESGGSYYASAVADKKNKKLIFFRKNKKEYNIKNHFVGNLPLPGEKVIILDDVISSGNTISLAVHTFQEFGCEVHAAMLFSYGWHEQISRNLGITIHGLSNAEELIEYGLSINRMSSHNAQIIRDFVAREEDRLVQLVSA